MTQRCANSCFVAACVFALLFARVGIAAEPAKAPAAEPGQLAPLLDGLSELHHKITTKSERAQKFFDQGLRLCYAFNHAEAIRAFKEVQRLDPICAMAYWGEAFALGSNINAPMQPPAIKPAYDAVQKALSLKANASKEEQAYIEALAARYSSDPKADRAALDRAYATAMAKVADAYPKDDDAQTLAADAIMNLMPWNYYTHDGHPREGTDVVLSRLETVIARNPKHIGALHMYIHATEEHYPQKAEKAADLLLPATTTAGHLIHMPSHTFMRLGRYADAYASNDRAVKADEHYIEQCHAQGMYPLAYYPHNIHFLMWAAERQGRADEAILQARKVSKQAHDTMAGSGIGQYENFYVMPYYMLARFGRWDEILATPVPDDKVSFVLGVWHCVRGLAQINKNNSREAAKELKAVQDLIKSGDFGGVSIGFNDPHVLLSIGAGLLEGEIAAAKNKYDAAILALDRAVRLEDNLIYDEPPDWPIPVRQTLGAVLLKAGRPVEAESVYWMDLKKNTENGYSLFGLWQALKDEKGREDDAKAIKARFDAAWKNATQQLSSSKF